MSAAANGAAGYGFDVAELVPYARHVHPIELAPGDLLFDTAGALHAITDAQSYRDGSIVTAEQDNAHRVWFSNDDPIIAILRRDERPTLTIHDRVFAAQDDPSWEIGDPAVIDTDSDVIVWEPDDGNPPSWAAGQLGLLGTIEPSSSPPFTQRTWYSNTWTNFNRDGATVETSAHLSGFTRAEVETIGARSTGRVADQCPIFTPAARCPAGSRSMVAGRIFAPSTAPAANQADAGQQSSFVPRPLVLEAPDEHLPHPAAGDHDRAGHRHP